MQWRRAPGGLYVTSGLSLVLLCPVCAQMSTNAASRMGGATKYATTSQAASTVPATAATHSPQMAGPAKVRPCIQDPRAFPDLSLHLPVALLSASPHFYFCSCQTAEIGSHIWSSARDCWQWLVPLVWERGRGREEGGGVFCRKSTCPGMSAATGICPARPPHRMIHCV